MKRTHSDFKILEADSIDKAQHEVNTGGGWLVFKWD